MSNKFLSYILRHHPERINLNLDPEGWASVDELLWALGQHGRDVSLEQLVEVVANDDKSRFTLSEDRQHIRAAQGHSVGISLGLKPQRPPPVLFHGTARSSLSAIMSDGLRPGRRNHVHLSLNMETARAVGRRHGSPVVISVDARRMAENGIEFLCSDNSVWLTEYVPGAYLKPLP